jgi:hypothetical protein
VKLSLLLEQKIFISLIFLLVPISKIPFHKTGTTVVAKGYHLLGGTMQYFTSVLLYHTLVTDNSKLDNQATTPVNVCISV